MNVFEAVPPVNVTVSSTPFTLITTLPEAPSENVKSTMIA